MSASWRPLTTLPDFPPLLFTAIFTTNSYSVHLTDLTSIWSESLDRRAIIRRSLDEDTSIDPSEDAEQLRLFLQNIQLGLDGGEGTSLTLSRTSSGLDLYVTATLPKGLKPLEWPVHLARSSQSTLTAHLIIPLLRAQNARVRELDGLIGMLHEKDHVIQKLADKLETTGADLGQVFPGAAGKGGWKLTRKLAEERIKGLGAFEAAAWRKKEREEEMDSEGNEISEVVEGVFGSKYGSTLRAVTDSALPGSWDKWWDRIDGSIQLPNLKRGKNATLVKTSLATRRNREPAAIEDDKDDFQIQATPPHLARSPHASVEKGESAERPSASLVMDDTTDESDDLDEPSQRSAVLDSYPVSQPKSQPRKLGAIGGPKLMHKLPPPPPAATVRRPETPPPKSKADHPVVDDDETATEDEDGSDGPPKPGTPLMRPVSPPPLTKLKTQSGLLRKIGGRKEEAEERRDRDKRPNAVAADGPEHEAQSTAEQKPKAQPHRLGIIGHSKTTASSSASYVTQPAELGADGERGLKAENRPGHVAGGGERDVSGDTVVKGQEERETPYELADRKREELKRELAEKAKAPAKKKRKF
jgi:XLF-Cernunnos, XRcc4-like factor, NHEJ component